VSVLNANMQHCSMVQHRCYYQKELKVYNICLLITRSLRLLGKNITAPWNSGHPKFSYKLQTCPRRYYFISVNSPKNVSKKLRLSVLCVHSL